MSKIKKQARFVLEVKKRKPVTLIIRKYFMVHGMDKWQKGKMWHKPELRYIDTINFHPNMHIITEKQFCYFLLERYGTGIYHIVIILKSIRRKYGIQRRGFQNFWYGRIEPTQYKRTKGTPRGLIRTTRLNVYHSYFENNFLHRGYSEYEEEPREEDEDDW